MATQSASETVPDRSKSRIKSPIEFCAGLFLLALAALAMYGAVDLDTGSLSRMGPGMMPWIASVAVAIFGAVLIALSFVAEGPDVERWSLRGMFFIFGAVVVFAMTIRGLGLAIAGPLAIMISALADRETRLVEIIPFAIALTIVSAILFKWLLGLPMPLIPFLIDE